MMKGEYVESHHHHHHHQHRKNDEAMFSKLNNPFSHHFHLSRQDEENTTNNHRSTTAPAVQSHKSGNDGATIEIVRRPRGRPPGSKNKPKPPVIITRNPEPAMAPFVLEVAGGNDVVDALSEFSRRRNIGLCVLTGSGTVANVTLRQPSSTPGSTITFHGRFDILSINATFLPRSTSHPSPNIFTISLAGPQGQIVGGAVAGGLMAAVPVFLIAASFNNPSYHRLPPEEEEAGTSSGGGGGGGGDGLSPAVSGGGGESGTTPGDGGMSLYSCNMGSDVIWAPTARPPPPPPPY